MSKTEHKSIKINMVLNAIKGVMGILFPLISFPYVSKILGVENLGKYNFSHSIISYFILLAGLGINTYAVREGARVRDSKTEIERFASEMLSINVFSTVVSYAGLFVLILIVPKFHNYTLLLVILSAQIGLKTIGIEWVYSIYEDYLYITIRSIVFHCISLLMLFVFVRSENDLVIYAIITVISSAGSCVLNYIHSRKYIKIHLIRGFDWKRHIKSILILFAMAVTVTIYVSSDTTILGFLCDDYTVGIYSVSVKVYTIIKTILSSVLVVSIPRLSALLGKNDKEGFTTVASDIYCTLLTVVFPAITGIILLRKDIVILLSDETYITATPSLTILSMALFFCLGAWFWGQCILVPLKQEKTVFIITVICALTNVVLNFILIPFWKENAAAFTTLIAEGVSFLWCWIKGKQYTCIRDGLKTFIKVAIGCASIFAYYVFLNLFFDGGVLYITLMIAGSVILYGVVEIVLGNGTVVDLIRSMKKKIIKKSKR